SRYLPLLGELPVVCTHHNIESSLLLSRAVTEDNVAVAAYLRHQAVLMEAEERRWCKRVALNVTVSTADAGRVDRLVRGANVAVVPNGVDTDAFRPATGAAGDGLVFVGGYGWYPNRDGMRFFADEILPLIRRRRALKTVWVGRAPEPVREEYDRA